MQDGIGDWQAVGGQRNDDELVYSEVDMQHWAKMPCWTYLELTCVTLGFEPGPILAASREQLQSDNVKLTQISKRSQLAYRAFEVGDLPACITPKKAIEWLDGIDEGLPEDLREIILAFPINAEGPLESLSGENLTTVVAAINSLSDKVGALDQSSANSGPQSKQIASLQRIVLTMAVKGYAYKPRAGRSKVYGEIADDSAELELNLHPDTVRTHLCAAVENHWNQTEN